MVLEAKTFILALSTAFASQLIALLDELYNKFLKAKLPDLYYNKSHIDCYNFIRNIKIILPFLELQVIIVFY